MSDPGRKKSSLRRALGWLQIALTIAVVVFWFFELRPQALGGPASFALVSGKSMEPLYHTGDVVIVHRHASYHVGQIVAYRVPKGDPAAGDQVIHRLIGGNGRTGFIVQGDNRTAPDTWHPKTGDVVGAAWLHIPKAGLVVRLLHTPIFLAALAALIAMATILAKGPKAKPEQPEVVAPTADPEPALEPEPLPAPAAVMPEPDREPIPVATPEPAVAAPLPPRTVERRAPVAATSESAERLRSEQFGRALRGYDRDEVRRALDRAAATLDYLSAELDLREREAGDLRYRLDRESQARDDLAQTLAFLQREHERVVAQLQFAESEMGRRRELESSLMSSLLSAERVAGDLRRHAGAEAESVLADARSEAQQILAAARSEREDVLREIETIRGALKTALDKVDDAASEAASSLLEGGQPPSGWSE